MTFRDLTILAVDDETDLLDIYVDLFKNEVGRVLRAEDGHKALGIIKSENVDIIVSDISMPGMSGLELLEKVREFNKSIPFIIVTGFGDKDGAVRALRSGAFDFIDKPFNFEALKKSVTQALETSIQLRNLTTRLAAMSSSLETEKKSFEEAASHLSMVKK